MLLRKPSGEFRRNVIYTFDFYDPWDYITADPAAEGYGEY
jgi:hypothetical protein